jgi:hypothetical protein
MTSRTPAANSAARASRSNPDARLAHPFIAPHRLAGCTKDWAAVDSYRPDPIEMLREQVRRRNGIADWLERTFADRLGWFIATLFPLCVAAFCIGWFGVRELLHIIGAAL